MKKSARLIALLLSVTLIFGLTACGKDTSSGDKWQVSWWIPVGEDAAFYAEYEDNPVLQWIEKNKTFNGKAIEFDFVVAPPGGHGEDWSRLMSTGDYCGIMDMSAASITAAELFEEGMIWDLTELVPAHMPNLMAYLEENPQLKDDLYSYVNGETKILMLRGFADRPEPNFQGYCYRRDWIAKYGTNPSTGAAFTYGYEDPDNYESWYDDVVFPNGTDEPLYISDWEWMFEIFQTALAEEGIEDGYCFSPFYMGYMATGDLYTGFGGGAPFWYVEGDTVVNGFTNDNMRAYLQCLNTWYNNGWLDERFDEHTGDMFFSVDSATVFQGKVGLWEGRTSTIGVQIAEAGTFSENAMVYGCRQPINDIYGGDAQKNRVPNLMYQYTRLNNPVIFTDKMSEDEVIAVLEFADYLLTEEGRLLGNAGLNAEQAAEVPNDFFEKYGLSDGCYTLDENGVAHTIIPFSDTAITATNLTRVSLCFKDVEHVDHGFDRYVQQATDAWDYYESTASIPESVNNALTAEQNQTITKIRASLDQFQQRTVPAIIKGDAYDLWDDASWQAFCDDINKYRADQVTQIYQETLDLFR